MDIGWKTLPVAALLSLATASVGRAQVTGSWEGQITSKKAAPVAAAAAVSQFGKFATGTVALDGDQTSMGGAYLVTGRATKKRITLKGTNPNGFKLVWAGRIRGTAMKGKARVKGPGAKLVGTLALAENPPLASDGSSCDSVYDANQMLFDSQVMPQVFTTCATCHVSGGQAQAARFQVTPGDARATARAVATFVDSANPSGSRVRQKPLLLVPHGGGQQFADGSAEEMLLTQWIGLVAAAHCN
jgi:hypothetical protein